MTDTHRREYLAVIAGSSICALAGCPVIEQDRYRNLRSSGRIELSDTDERVIIQFGISFRSVGGEESWRQFHDARVVGLGQSNAVLCQKEIGHVPKGDAPNEDYNLSLECPRRPEVLEIRAREGPCSPDTTLGMATWGKSR